MEQLLDARNPLPKLAEFIDRKIPRFKIKKLSKAINEYIDKFKDSS